MIYEIFSSIAEKYDLMGHVFSLGIDGIWRNIASKEAILDKPSYNLLDAATGTGSLAIEIAKKSEKEHKNIKITGIDINKDMLDIARRKIKSRSLNNVIDIKTEDAMKLDEPPDYYDVVTAGFLLRNVDDTMAFSSEMERILKKGGKFILLEMGRIDFWPADLFFKLYSPVIRFVGSFIDKRAYRWLTSSIMTFDRYKMAGILREYSFKDIKIKNLPFCIGFIITGEKG